jgi:hypothetical protein
VTGSALGRGVAGEVVGAASAGLRAEPAGALGIVPDAFARTVKECNAAVDRDTPFPGHLVIHGVRLAVRPAAGWPAAGSSATTRPESLDADRRTILTRRHGVHVRESRLHNSS